MLNIVKCLFISKLFYKQTTKIHHFFLQREVVRSIFASFAKKKYQFFY